MTVFRITLQRKGISKISKTLKKLEGIVKICLTQYAIFFKAALRGELNFPLKKKKTYLNFLLIFVS